MQPDFNAMTKRELRAYLVAHSSDQDAFHAFVDRFTAEAAPETFDLSKSNNEIAEAERLIRQRIGHLKNS